MNADYKIIDWKIITWHGDIIVAVLAQYSDRQSAYIGYAGQEKLLLSDWDEWEAEQLPEIRPDDEDFFGPGGEDGIMYTDSYIEVKEARERKEAGMSGEEVMAQEIEEYADKIRSVVMGKLDKIIVEENILDYNVAAAIFTNRKLEQYEGNQLYDRFF